MNHVWAGFSQVGASILITAKNQTINGVNVPKGGILDSDIIKKYALDQMGFAGGPTRPPLGTVPPDAQRQIREQLAALGVLADVKA